MSTPRSFPLHHFDYFDTFVSSTAANNYEPHLHIPRGILFGPDGNLYVSSIEALFPLPPGAPVKHRDAIVVFNRQGQPARLPIYFNEESASRVFARAMIFGPRGDLFIPTVGGGVRRYTAGSNYENFTFLSEPEKSPADPWFTVFRGTNPTTLKYEEPTLNIIRNGASLDLSWPSRCVGWQVQFQHGGLEAGWSNMPDTVTSDHHSVPFLQEQPAGFFRLEAP